MNNEQRKDRIDRLNTFLETEKERVSEKVYMLAMKEFLELLSDYMVTTQGELKLELEGARIARATAIKVGADDALVQKANDLIWTVGASLLKLESDIQELEVKKARLAKLM